MKGKIPIPMVALLKPEHECMDCGAQGFSVSSVQYKGLTYEVFPNGWAVHIQDDGDYLLVCDGCIAKGNVCSTSR